MTRSGLGAGDAARFAELALASIRRAYPHKLDHVLVDDADARTPSALHPAFHGSFDWHSCVHMHWTLARLVRRFPALAATDEIACVFDAHFTREAIEGELAYLGRPSSASFERTYGWAWLLKLAAELHAGDGGDFRRWCAALTPLADAFAARFVDFLARAQYPLRYGVHPNSAFALALALEYARTIGDARLADACTAHALRWFAGDVDAPARFEPSGTDFLSPALVEVELMRSLLDAAGFAEWLARFLPDLGAREPASLFAPAQVADRSDPQLVHLDGLNLSRAWCFRGIAASLPAGDPRILVADEAAELHLRAGLAGLDSDDFVGAHWLASFAVLACDGA